MDENKGKIFNIQRFSTHDGPGIRTSVFLKGCSLNCIWCHNPESINNSIQLQYFSDRCMNCGKCTLICPKKAHTLINEMHQFDRSLCCMCGSCAEECVYEALVIAGRYVTANEVMKTIKKDIAYYNNSGGGITISGGEPLVQLDFVYDLLNLAKVDNIHTAIDTSLNVKLDSIKKVEPLTDLFLVDIKSFDCSTHKEYTGCDNILIMNNLNYMLHNEINMYIRIPIIQGLNDSLLNAESIAEILTGFKNVLRVELLPYHNYGMEKAKSLDIKQMEYSPPSDKRLEEVKDVFRKKNIRVF